MSTTSVPRPVRPPCACELPLLTAFAELGRAIEAAKQLGYGSELIGKLQDAKRSMLSALTDLS